MDGVEDCSVVLDFEDNSPFVEVSECSSFDLNPVEPVVVTILLSIDVVDMNVIKLSVMFSLAKRENEIEVSLNSFINFNLLKSGHFMCCLFEIIFVVTKDMPFIALITKKGKK